MAVLLAFTFGACGDDGGTGGDTGTDTGMGSDTGMEMDPAEVACGEVEEAGTPIVASETRSADTPEVTLGAEPYLVELPAAGTGYLRVVTDAPEQLAILFFERADVLTDIYDDADTSIGVVSAGENPFCAADLPEHFDVDFETAGTYYLELTAASAQWVLIGDGEGHGHEE